MRRTRSERGQTLVIALLVSFTLLVLGGVFIAVIARNIVNVQQARARISADLFAESGLQYAIDQLVRSEFGADWRPIPDNITNTADPDYFWLKPYNPADGTGGFTRINLQNGRALIRVSYQSSGPVHRQPVIKIESVGRVGVVDPTDPTTFTLADRVSRAERVAYMQIGTIDYLRFVMNKEQRGMLMDLGVPSVGLLDEQGREIPYLTILGEPGEGGGSIFVNGNLRFSGRVRIAVNPQLGERVYVAGEVTHNQGADVEMLVGTESHTLLPSSHTEFHTVGGLYRDGRPLTAIDGYPRAIAYLEPPRMDTVDPATNRPRYIAATMESGIWRQRQGGGWFNTGQYGYGRGIYINNALDIQRESRGFLGGYTLRSDWVNPGKSRFWNGPFYEPPGVFIELIETLNPDGTVRAQGFRITRNQAEPRDVWYDPITGRPTNLKTMNFFFLAPRDPNDSRLISEIVLNAPNRDEFVVPFNGVIYAEGNVRVKGRIPSGRQITIVTNGTAYIEGNLVKGDARSALAIIAKDYVCVNTTQFLQRTFDSPAVAQGDPTNAEAPYFFEVLPDKPMRLLFSFGTTPDYTGNFGGIRLYLRHAAAGAGSFINLLVNPSEFAGLQAFYRFNIPGFPSTLYPLGRTTFQVYPNYEKVVFQLVPPPNGSSYILTPERGLPNMLQLQLESVTNLNNFGLPTDNQPYRFSAAAVQPLDIRIEAALFAQEGCFFVIPGYWFNTDPKDTRENFRLTGARPAGVASPEFPFYGEPLDIKITIVGSIAENFTASLGDQTEWLRKWGWIPRQYGNSNFEIPIQHRRHFHDTAERYAVNLSMRHDPVFRLPEQVGRIAYDSTQDPSGRHPGRLLPPIPRLPVCPKPIYAGDIRP
ncbi:MAG: type II secretion system GspH family protein [Fimbriimonadales bacterium]|nr:type II secretion system GspH family protein [Fimbriimonadales bacterium]